VRPLAKRILRRDIVTKGTCTPFEVQVHVDLGFSPLGLVLQAQIKTTDAAALHLDLGVVDEVLELAGKSLEACDGLAGGVAVHYAAELDLLLVAVASVDIVLRSTGNALEVAVVPAIHAEHPVAQGQAVVGVDTACPTIPGILASQVTRDRDVEQVVEGEGVVVAECGAALVLAGGFVAAVISGEQQAQGQDLTPAHDQVAVARLVGGFNLDIGSCRGNALEVLQRLLHIAQVQYVAGPRRNRIESRGARIGLGKPDGPDAPGQHGEAQTPVREALGWEHDARGHEASIDQDLLRTLGRDVHAVHPQAAPDGGVAP
jgi:hypothetical protein